MYIYGHVDIRAVTAVLMEGEGCLRSFFVVIESREDAVRTLFENCLPRVKERLSRIEDVGVLACRKGYCKRYHDLCTEDKGYISFHDDRKCREIFVCRDCVGFSNCFHVEKDVRHFVNVLDPQSTHESYNYMTPGMKNWVVNNMKYVALQLFDTEGNIVLFCKSGRSRSPMYLVAYLIIFYSMSMKDAIKLVRDLLRDQRNESLDRTQSLLPAIQRIYNDT
jgi:hypothetical protein